MFSDVPVHHCYSIKGSTFNVLKGHHCIQYAHGFCVLEIQSGPSSDVMSVACDVDGPGWEGLNDYFIGCLGKDSSKAVKVEVPQTGWMMQRLMALEAETSGQVVGRDGFFQGVWERMCSRFPFKL